MPFYRSGDINLFYEESGSGDALLFLHGFTLDHRMWPAQSQFFSKSFRVIIPDSRGHGKSDAPQTGYSRDHRLEDLKNLLDELKIETAHLVGLSMGGSTAIGFALKYPESLKSLVLVSTGAAGYSVSKKLPIIDEIARTEGVDTARRKWLEWNLAWYKTRHQQVGTLLKELMQEHSGAIWADPMRGKYPRTNDLDNVHHITLPTLIIAGELDKIFLPLAEELNRKINDSKLLVFEDTGHILNLEEPEKFNDALRNFLEKLN